MTRNQPLTFGDGPVDISLDFWMYWDQINQISQIQSVDLSDSELSKCSRKRNPKVSLYEINTKQDSTDKRVTSYFSEQNYPTIR